MAFRNRAFTYRGTTHLINPTGADQKKAQQNEKEKHCVVLQTTITLHPAVLSPATESAQHSAVLELWESSDEAKLHTRSHQWPKVEQFQKDTKSIRRVVRLV